MDKICGIFASFIGFAKNTCRRDRKIAEIVPTEAVFLTPLGHVCREELENFSHEDWKKQLIFLTQELCDERMNELQEQLEEIREEMKNEIKTAVKQVVDEIGERQC